MPTDSLQEDVYQTPAARPSTPASGTESATSFIRIHRRPSSHGKVYTTKSGLKHDTFLAGRAGPQSNTKTWTPDQSSVTSLDQVPKEERSHLEEGGAYSSRSSSVSGYSFTEGKGINYEYSEDGVGPSVPTDILLQAEHQARLLDLPSQRSRDSLFTASSVGSENNEACGYVSEQSAISQELVWSMSPSDHQPNTDSLHADSNHSLHDNSFLPNTTADRNSSVSLLNNMSHVSPSIQSQLTGTGADTCIPDDAVPDDVASAKESGSRRFGSKRSFSERSSLNDTSRCSSVAETDRNSPLNKGIVISLH